MNAKHISFYLTLVVMAVAAVVMGLLIGSSNQLDGAAILQLRLPRVLAAFAVGGLLAVSGALLQVLTRNPLAEPSVIGVSGGAVVGALVALFMGAAGGLGVGVGAWVGALLSLLILLGLSGGVNASSARLILAGVMIATACGALSSLLVTFATDTAMPGMIHWLMGDLDTVLDLEAVGAVLGLWCVMLILMIRYAPQIHILQFGQDKATSLGVDVNSFRVRIVFITSLATAASVSLAGAIGFVGLLVPHLLRAWVARQHGSDQRLILPASLLLGGSVLVLADLIARTIVAPAQLPVGVITALIGVPSFLWLLNRLKYWSA